MKKTTKILITITFITCLVISFTVTLFSLPTGYTGVTRKSTTTGCSCHTNNTAITGAVTGPDTVAAGSTTIYTITITRSAYTGAHGGVDIAVRLGSLTPGTGLKLQNGELTHQSRQTFTNGVCTLTFSYVAPSTAGIDTIWSNVVAGYSNGFNWSPEKRVVVSNPLGIGNNQTAISYSLQQNYPNPFNPTTTIGFDLPKNTDISLIVYDVNGKKVEQLLNEQMGPGRHEINWNAANYSSGVYYYVLKSKDFEMTKKMILVK